MNQIAKLTSFQSSEDFPIYIGDTVEDPLTKAQGTIVSYAFNEDQQDQVQFIVENKQTLKKKGYYDTQTWGDTSILSLLQKGDRPELLEPEYVYGDIIRDMVTEKEVLISEVIFRRTGCISYFVRRIGVDKDGNRFNTYYINVFVNGN